MRHQQIQSYQVVEPLHVFIGSYSDSQKRPSIYDLVTKEMVVKKMNISVVNPSYLLCRNGYIYFVEQTNNGRLSVIDSSYNLLQTVNTHGNDPCHIAINQDNTLISVANYTSGSFIIYHLKEHVFGNVFSFVIHDGSSVNPDRQSSAHAHCSLFMKINGQNVLFVSDLGTDIVYWYKITSTGLICQKQKCVKMVGCGPRHLAADTNGRKLIYMTGELDSSIRVLSYQTGKLQMLSAYRVSTNPNNFPSEVKFYEDTVWMANRGDDYLIVFDITTPGTLKQRFRFKVGQCPRHFKISKQGTVYVACQNRNSVQRYRYEQAKVFLLGSFEISTPSCISFEE